VASGNPALLFRGLLHFRHLAPGRFGKDEAGKAGEAGGQQDLSEAATGLEQGLGTVFDFGSIPLECHDSRLKSLVKSWRTCAASSAYFWLLSRLDSGGLVWWIVAIPGLLLLLWLVMWI
jgi:hypothetical protein